MADPRHITILRQASRGKKAAWNEWRKANPDVEPDLSKADLSKGRFQGLDFGNANLSGANLDRADLRGVNLRSARLFESSLVKANLQKADMREALLMEANLWLADLSGANLVQATLANAILVGAELDSANLEGALLGGANFSSAKLHRANLRGANCLGCFFAAADLSEADFRDAKLGWASLVKANLAGADLTGANVYGVAAWDVDAHGSVQRNLVITPEGQAAITVDDLELAQFVYLLLNRPKLRNVIDTITSKAVLILGRFTPERKSILDAMAEELRRHNLVPVIFDFERSTARDFTETIKILAGMSLFVIADITNPKSAPLELQATIPDYQIPFVPIIQEKEQPFSMFSDLSGKYDWVLRPMKYRTVDELRAGFKVVIIDRAMEKHRLLQIRRADKSAPEPIEYFASDGSARRSQPRRR